MRQRKLLLPPFHGERIQRYGELIREATLGEMESWPVGEPFALRPHTQRITLAVIMRAVFGVHDEQRLTRFERLIEDFSARVSLVTAFPPLRRSFGRWSPWARFLRAQGGARPVHLRGDRPAPGGGRQRGGGARRRPLAADGRPRRGRRADERPGAARRAGDDPRRRPRDDRDRAGLGGRAAGPQPGGAGAAARLDRRRRGRLPRRDDQGDAAGAPGDRRRGAQADRADDDRRLRAAGRHLRDGGDRRPALSPGPLPRAGARSAPSAFSRAKPTTTPGSPSAAASAAASAPPSPNTRCGSSSARSVERARAAGRRPEAGKGRGPQHHPRPRAGSPSGHARPAQLLVDA